MSTAPQNQYDAVIRCDASSTIGGGHVIRCLTLAAELKRSGRRVLFAVSPDTLDILPTLSTSGFDVVDVDNTPQALIDAANQGCQLLVVDHYVWDETYHRQCRPWAETILVIDDMANRQLDADVVLDQTFGREVGEYNDLVPPHCRVLTGAGYALLRPEFAELKNQAYQHHKTCQAPRRIVVSMGMTDSHNFTKQVLQALSSVDEKLQLDVVLLRQAPHFEDVLCVTKTLDHNVTLHADGVNMAQLLADCDLSIGASGVTALERCCLSLPSITIVMADNQERIAEAMQCAGATINLGWYSKVMEHDIVQAFRDIALNTAQYAQMVDKAVAVCDGTGTKRVVSVIDEVIAA
ncbi:UDP-2,4-diacetamido-2,4,6-trideoxy-beta-L-altropyranose hydrolase [Magnetovibrio sp. PR-2]|uniref:UDP-2,4-diacetamido-2,4, 6-trideoxy-beta-L-altropyranose hydrolase n=1 Tax=Magnetovibrio sp. PR-2 TaxID=3120356 RepID=UPI002FCE1E0C